MKGPASLITGIVDAVSIKQNRYDTPIRLRWARIIHTVMDSPNRYNKNHLVPALASSFRWSLSCVRWRRSSITHVATAAALYPATQLHALLRHKLTAAICYEKLFLANRCGITSARTPTYLRAISNDALVLVSPLARGNISRWRGCVRLELARPLLRGTNNGITAVIGPQGEIQAMIRSSHAGASLPKSRRPPA